MTENHKDETTPLKKTTTSKLEHLPSSKKRTLNIDPLSTPLTDNLEITKSKSSEPRAQSSEIKDLNSIPETAPHQAITNTTANLTSSPNTGNNAIDGTVKFTTPSTASSKEETKEPQAKPSAKKESNEVVQEILKEVAKEVKKDNVAKPSSKAVEEALKFVEEPPTVEMKAKQPAIVNAGEPKEAKEAREARETKQYSTDTAKQYLKADTSWAEKPIQQDVKDVKAVFPKEEAKEIAKEVKEKSKAASASTESDSTESVDKVIEMPLFNSINKFSDPVPEVKSAGAKIKSLVLWTIPLWILLGVAIGIVYNVPALREKAAERLPSNIAKSLKLTSKDISFLSIQEYRYSVNEKENTVTISGVVKNLSEKAVGPLQLEFQLTKRDDVRLTDSKVVPLDPVELPPQQEGKYTFTIPAKDYQETKFLRITTTNSNLELKVKKLGIIDPPLDPSKISNPLAPLPNNKPKSPDNNIYDGAVN